MTFDLTRKVLTEIDAMERQRRLFSVNRWIEGEEGKIFIRITKRLGLDHSMTPTIDLASVEIDEEYRKSGVFSELLQHVERWAVLNNKQLFVESVLNKHLLESLRRRGYQDLPGSEPPCVLKSHAQLLALHGPQSAPISKAQKKGLS